MRFFIADEDCAVLDFQDPRVGDGDFEDLGGEIFDACRRGRDGLGVDVPIDLPDFRGDLIEQARLFHFVSELGSKDFGEGLNREIEVYLGGVPLTIGR